MVGKKNNLSNRMTVKKKPKQKTAKQIEREFKQNLSNRKKLAEFRGHFIDKIIGVEIQLEELILSYLFNGYIGNNQGYLFRGFIFNKLTIENKLNFIKTGLQFTFATDKAEISKIFTILKKLIELRNIVAHWTGEHKDKQFIFNELKTGKESISVDIESIINEEKKTNTIKKEIININIHQVTISQAAIENIELQETAISCFLDSCESYILDNNSDRILILNDAISKIPEHIKNYLFNQNVGVFEINLPKD